MANLRPSLGAVQAGFRPTGRGTVDATDSNEYLSVRA